MNQASNGMRILVTGGSGNVGTTVVATLQREGHTVRVFDLKSPRCADVEFVEGSVTDPIAVERAVTGMDAVVHLAAIPAYRPEIPSVEFMHVNVTGTFNVLEAAGMLGVGKVVFASSDSALGLVFSTHPVAPEYFPVDENHPLRPQDPYGLSKLLGEELCKRASRRYGIDTICLRFCWVWFEDTYPHRAAMIQGDQAPLAKTLWGYVDVRDAAQACSLAIKYSGAAPGDPFFITAKDTFADRPSMELIQEHYPSVRKVSDAYVVEPCKALFDISKARSRLGYDPKHSCR